MNIGVGDMSICVDDKDIEYSISFRCPHDVTYGINILRIPYVGNLICSCDDEYHEVIQENHNEIKRYLTKFSDICNAIPNLVICKLPTRDDFGPGNQIIFSHNEYAYLSGCGIDFISRNKYRLLFRTDIPGYDICLHINIGDHDGGDNVYILKDKVAITNEPFNAELFTDTIRSYVDQHLLGLSNLFKVNNIKSAKK